MATAKRLWNRNFAILWQGQLISDFGNAAFTVALGFWVLERTGGNTALMGLVEAVFALPAVLLGPLAGAVADRKSRKWIIVLADFLRGLLFALMGAMLVFDVFPFWAIYPIAVAAGSLGAFFGPAISAVIPDIVSTDNLTKANSARSMSSTASQLVGNAFGGVLYALITAPWLILFNGLSFLYASVTQLFTKIPPIKHRAEKQHILRDMGDGIRYTFGNRGLRSLLVFCIITNFFAMIGITLLTPLFQSTAGFGVQRYGFMMGSMMAGAVLGMLALSILKIPASKRAGIFNLALCVEVAIMIPIGFIYNVNVLYPMAFVMGICNAIVNMMVQTVLQTTVPQEHRGKVFGIVGTVSGALMPLAMAASGLIASVAGVRPTIVGSFVAVMLGGSPLLFDRHFRRFINTDIGQSEELADAGAPGLAELPAAE